MHRWIVETMEFCLRHNTRRHGVGVFPDPHRYFGPGGVDEARRLCRQPNADLLSFLRPPGRTAATDGVTVRGAEVPGGMRIRNIRFPSPAPSGRPVNDLVQIRVLDRGTSANRADADGRPVVIFHHPVYQSRLRIWRWFLEPLIRRVPVAVVSAPHHFDRIEPGERPSESSVNPNPWRLFEAVQQWCREQPAVHHVLEDRLGLRPCAVVGYSFGAFQSLLLASAGALDLPLVTIASTNRYAWGVLHGVIGGGILEGMRRVGIDEALLWEMTDSLQVERWVPVLRGRPVLYVNGRWDRVDPPPSLERLEAALQPSRSLRIDGGHGTLVVQRGTILPEVIRFLEEAASLPSNL